MSQECDTAMDWHVWIMVTYWRCMACVFGDLHPKPLISEARQGEIQTNSWADKQTGTKNYDCMGGRRD
eukprot:scaffold143760_cov50-Prasinocladus_malaysianus.AAC.1